MPKRDRCDTHASPGNSSHLQTMGKSIIDHQAVAFMLADMAIGVDAARGLVWKAAWAKDVGQRNCALPC